MLDSMAVNRNSTRDNHAKVPLHMKYTDDRTDPEGSGSSSGAGAIGANAEGGGLYVQNESTTTGAWSGATFRVGTADARIAYELAGTNQGQMSFTWMLMILQIN